MMLFEYVKRGRKRILTIEQARRVLAYPREKAVALAAEFGCSESTISIIRRGKRYTEPEITGYWQQEAAE